VEYRWETFLTYISKEIVLKTPCVQKFSFSTI
jgi:hypothetical protein